MAIGEIRQGDEPWPSETKEAAKWRVRTFLAARKTVLGRRGGLDEDVIYSVGTDTGTIDLTVSDLEELTR
jgi:hypothetical protein